MSIIIPTWLLWTFGAVLGVCGLALMVLGVVFLVIVSGIRR